MDLPGLAYGLAPRRNKWASRMCNLIHEFPTIGCSTEARNFQFITLIRIKQVIIPVAEKILQIFIPQPTQNLMRQARSIQKQR